MRLCTYCGLENPAAATCCAGCGTSDFSDSTVDGAPQVEEGPPFYFPALSERDAQKTLVTLVQCRTLSQADLIVTLLDGAGIAAVIPDQFLMQAICWNLSAYGYVRVQIAPRDYSAAAELLSSHGGLTRRSSEQP